MEKEKLRMMENWKLITNPSCRVAMDEKCVFQHIANISGRINYENSNSKGHEAFRKVKIGGHVRVACLYGTSVASPVCL